MSTILNLRRAGTDPERISLSWNQLVRKEANGDLLIGGLRQKRPKVSQDGREIEARYLLKLDNQVQLALADYDRSQAITIDPVLQYSTYLGRPAQEWGDGIQVDRSGSAYITCSAHSPPSPSLNPFQQVASISQDAYVLKLTPSGNAVAFYVVLGGSFDDSGEGIALNNAGNTWIAGVTQSPDFPTKNAVQPILVVDSMADFSQRFP